MATRPPRCQQRLTARLTPGRKTGDAEATGFTARNRRNTAARLLTPCRVRDGRLVRLGVAVLFYASLSSALRLSIHAGTSHTGMGVGLPGRRSMNRAYEADHLRLEVRPVCVTIVVATYNRPQALRLAIGSVLDQTCPDWQLLVIGDCCDEATGAMIAGIDDPRIRYINLPERCGEQSGPNSVGMALADTPYVALLNHDDLWLPEHLELGLSRLDASGADFYAARAAFVQAGAAEPDRIEFVAVTPRDRTLSQAFYHAPAYFEPSSGWILRREAAAAVGAWRASTELSRTPLEDWVLRAWRVGLRLIGDERITVLKPRLLEQVPGGQAAYDAHPVILDRLAHVLTDEPQRLRQRIEAVDARAPRGPGRDIFGYARSGSMRLEDRAARWLNPWSAALYRVTGFDVMERLCRDLGLKPGFVLRWALMRRTGETLGDRPDLNGLVAAAREQLSAASLAPENVAADAGASGDRGDA